MPRRNKRINELTLRDSANLGLRFRPEQTIIKILRRSQRVTKIVRQAESELYASINRESSR